MQSYRLDFIDGHLIVICDDKRFVFDTGSPGSFGFITVIEFDEKSFNLLQSFGGFTAEDLSHFLNM